MYLCIDHYIRKLAAVNNESIRHMPVAIAVTIPYPPRVSTSLTSYLVTIHDIA